MSHAEKRACIDDIEKHRKTWVRGYLTIMYAYEAMTPSIYSTMKNRKWHNGWEYCHKKYIYTYMYIHYEVCRLRLVQCPVILQSYLPCTQEELFKLKRQTAFQVLTVEKVYRHPGHLLAREKNVISIHVVIIIQIREEGSGIKLPRVATCYVASFQRATLKSWEWPGDEATMLRFEFLPLARVWYKYSPRALCLKFPLLNMCTLMTRHEPRPWPHCDVLEIAWLLELCVLLLWSNFSLVQQLEMMLGGYSNFLKYPAKKRCCDHWIQRTITNVPALQSCVMSPWGLCHALLSLLLRFDVPSFVPQTVVSYNSGEVATYTRSLGGHPQTHTFKFWLKHSHYVHPLTEATLMG